MSRREPPSAVLLLFPAYCSPPPRPRPDPEVHCCARTFARGPGGRVRVLECIRPKHPLEEPCNPWPVAADPLELECPRCSSSPGEQCTAPTGQPCKTHLERLELAARTGVWLEREPIRDIPGPECHTTGGDGAPDPELEAGGLAITGACACGGAFAERLHVGRPDLLERARRGEHVGMTTCDGCREPLPVFLEELPGASSSEARP